MVIDTLHAWAALVALAVSGGALAHGDAHPPASAAAAVAPAKAEQTPFGIAGDPAKVTRTVAIDMSDRMRFEPAEVTVRRGDTLRFVLRNRGAVLHEMVIGTSRELEEHAALMKKFPDMVHDAPQMAHVAPGATGEIVWRFNRAGTFRFACLVPGHYEAGMAGRIVVR